jgi:hypothetical protein
MNRVIVCMNRLCREEVIEWSILAGKLRLREFFGYNSQKANFSSLAHIINSFCGDASFELQLTKIGRAIL